MKILLIIPKYTYSNLTRKPSFEYAPPIGLAYISSVLKREGYEIDCLNLNHLEGSVEELINKALDKKKYDCVCSGHMGLGFRIIEKIIEVSHRHKSNPKVIIGGLLITSEPELMVKALNFDFGIIGEGEVTIIKLLKCLENNGNPRDVKGICFRNNRGESVFTEPAEPIENLNSIPFPDFGGLELDKQLNNMSNGALYNYFDYPRTYTLIGSRGCPFQCTFCYHMDKKYRLRSTKNIIEEIKHAIKKYKINSFWLNDDMFAYDKKRMNEFCVEMKKIINETPWEFKWACSAPVTAVDRETLITLKDAGCYFIGFGFESYSRKILRSMKKPITPEQIDRTIKLCRELKMPIVGNFIFGDIAETKETARETLNYWKKNCDGQVQLHFIHPYPKSEIYLHCLRKGIIKNKLDYIKNHIHHTNILNMTESMTDDEYEELVKEILEAKVKYTQYVIPHKIKKMKSKRYEVEIKCPFCNEVINYKNSFIKNKFYFVMYPACKNKDCHMRFFIVSRLYKFTTDNYKQLDFLRKKYLRIRDKILGSRI